MARNPSGLGENNQGLALDRTTTRTNYNVDDGVMKSESFPVRTRADYRLNDHWILTNELAGCTADRADLTAAVYQITQDDILTRDPANPVLTIQGGEQQSQRIEVSLSAAVTERLRIDASGAILNSKFNAQS